MNYWYSLEADFSKIIIFFFSAKREPKRSFNQLMTEQGQETDFYLHDPMPGLDALFGGCTQPLAVSSVMLVLDFWGGDYF